MNSVCMYVYLETYQNHQTDANCGYAIKFCGFMEIVTITFVNTSVLVYYTRWSTAFELATV
jgi:hypothetical protein